MRKHILFTQFLLLFSAFSFGQTKLPLFFSDSMVLQRNTNAAIWGTDVANRKIKVTGSWGKVDSTITNSAGNWKLALATPAAGGPYTLTINGSSTIIIKDVQIGEVWLCAGQSNMEMPMKGYISSAPFQLVDSSDFFIANSSNSKLRVFMSSWNGTSRVPVTTLLKGTWETASPASTPDFSATAYFFARKLQETLGIPVGIIVTARGGSSIESWMDSATLATVEPVIIPNVVNWQDAHATPTIIYNTMLNPFIGISIKGIIWSQGEANVSNSSDYQEMCTKMITSWRSKWGIGDFSFYLAQLLPAGSTDNIKHAIMREAQLNTSLVTKNSGLAVIMDLFPTSSVHYPKKKVVGDRLANWALVKDYNVSGVATGPIFKSLTINNDVINLRFNYSGNGLTANVGLSNFEIAGADLRYFAATATFADFNFSINVRSSSVSNPLYVRYAFKNAIGASLFNREGFPAPSFRTENLVAILPVTFGNTNIINKNGLITISWNTLVEINIKDYEVQRSLDGINFTSIANVKANGTNTNYQFEDNSNLNNKVLYYRIKANNNDGVIEYSSIKNIKLNDNNSIKIINPSHNSVSIYCSNSFSGSIVVTDNLGKTLAIKTLNNYNGALKIPLPKTFKGVAILKITTLENESYTRRVTVL